MVQYSGSAGTTSVCCNIIKPVSLPPSRRAPDITAAGRALGRFVFDALGFEYGCIEIDCARFVTGRIDGVYLNELLKPGDGFIFDGLSHAVTDK